MNQIIKTKQFMKGGDNAGIVVIFKQKFKHVEEPEMTDSKKKLSNKI